MMINSWLSYTVDLDHHFDFLAAMEHEERDTLDAFTSTY